MAAITLSHVSKRYPNGRHAVRDLTIEIADRELLVLLGPSGSGKSTVLRLIAGLETPSEGDIHIDGRLVNHLAPQDRDLAMVFQSYALYPHKTVRDNLAFGLRTRHVDRVQIDERVRAAAIALGIDALLERKPAQLSGGERQRVALGRAIVREPKAFLLDEPLSNLDPTLRASTRAELALLHRRLATTMIHVTHDQEEAMTLGERVAIMRDGILEQIAPAIEVYRRPANAFVARFVGSPAMNLWQATSHRAGDRHRLTSAVCALEVAANTTGDPPDGDVLVGVRPHDLEVVGESGGDLTGVVEVIEPLGALTVVHVRVPRLDSGLMRAVVPADTEVGVGGSASFAIRRDRVHLFDVRTERRVN